VLHFKLVIDWTYHFVMLSSTVSLFKPYLHF